MGRFIVLICLLLIPFASAEPGINNPTESTPATMYMHLNGMQDIPINTQKPSDIYARDVKVGVATHSMCIESPTGSMTSNSYHTWYGFSSPSIVEYDVDQGGEPRYHPERGLSFDVELDRNVDPVFHWYMVGAMPVEADGTEQVHPPIPNVIIRTIVREGDEISVENVAFNTGQVIAQGQTPPTTLAGDATEQTDYVKVHRMGEQYLYEFTVPLTIEKDVIDHEESYNIRVDAFMDEPLCNGPNPGDSGDYAMADYLLIHTSPEFRPRLDWNIMNPLRIEAMHPMFVGDDLAIHTAANSPWGSYDVQGDLPYETQMVFEIEGPSPAMSLDQILVKDHTRGHDAHGEAVQSTWLWSYKADQAKEGVYTLTMKITNDQGTAEATGVATFRIGAGDGVNFCGTDMEGGDVKCHAPTTQVQDEQAPGVPVLALLGAIGAVAALRRK